MLEHTTLGQNAAGLKAAVGGDTGSHHMAVDRLHSKPKQVLMVVANPSISTNNNWPVGFWAAELTHPYHEFTERGVRVIIASPAGGKVEFDSLSDPRDPSGWSAGDIVSLGFIHTPFYEAEKITGALCHGVSALINVRLSNGAYLVAGKTVTGFANVEEEFGNAAAGVQIMPWRLEDVRRQRGANYVQAGLFKSFGIRDGRLVTGRQQYSGRRVAQMVIDMLGV